MTTQNNSSLPLITVGILVPIVVACLYFFFGLPLNPKDSCLDRGGSYNAETKKCEMTDVKSELQKGMLDATTEIPFLSEITYSNLADESSKQEVKTALEQAGLSEETISDFFGAVEEYNTTIEAKSLAAGFQKSSALKPRYDEGFIAEKWEESHPDFVGYNCRLTSYGLLKHFIAVDSPQEVNAKNLFIDNDALRGRAIFNESEKAIFDQLFAAIPAPDTRDVSQLVALVKENWAAKGIRFTNPNASLVSVFIHDTIDEDRVNVFVGHVGILVPSADGGYFFIEKISFELPYQVLKFANKQELSDYLMYHYDVDTTGSSAQPFIFDNGELIEGYRVNPEKKLQ